MLDLEATAARASGAGYLRHPACVPVRLREIPTAIMDRPHGPALGAIRFTTTSRVAAGAVVEAAVDVAGETWRFRGRVHWVRPAGRHFEVGLRLVDPEQASRARMVEQACHVEAYRQRSARRSGHSLALEQAAARWIERCAARFAVAWEQDPSLS